eukprot:TRINITY_DN2992_c1_g1_i1.p1 TRINITY_DN2992_c1_g1~~TRINITY_DN2992_c1_g1_i1.p1  ORF type:complete len:418 (+),score=97.04 TRINITY_DN2992_c1_g1_i1:45-1256(+)
MTEGFEQLKALFTRSPTRRLASVFELDKRFQSTFFAEAVHPNNSHLLRLFLHDLTGPVQVDSVGATLAPPQPVSPRYLDNEKRVVERFVAVCSPTDAVFGSGADTVKTAGQFLFLVVVMQDRIATEGPKSGSVLVELVTSALQTGTAPSSSVDAKYKGVVDLTLDFRKRAHTLAMQEGFKGSSGQFRRFIDSTANLFRSLLELHNNNNNNTTTNDNNNDLSPFPFPCATIDAWIKLWTAMGYPSDPFLSEHHTDETYNKLLSLTLDSIRLTQDAATALSLSTSSPTRSRSSSASSPLSLSPPSSPSLPRSRVTAPTSDTNAVREMMRECNITVQEALDLVVSIIEYKIDEFFTICASMPFVEADSLWYVEFLKKILRGHWSLLATEAGLSPVHSAPPSPRRSD